MTNDLERTARRLERRVLRFVREQALLRDGETALLAVSGGQDSLALLLILAALAPRLGVRCVATYVDHAVRPPAETAADRELVAQVAGDVGAPFVAATVERTPHAGRSSEAALREGRYRALARLAAETGATAVATGHTRSDQAETVLLRLLRGAGAAGLAAMAPSAAWPVPCPRPPRLVRPLLVLAREETATYCAARGVQPRIDPENRNPRYLRNRVRHDVLPLLHDLNPKIETALVHLAEEAAAWRAALEPGTDAGMRAADGQVELNRALLRRLPAPQRTTLLRAALQAVRPEQPAPRRAHLNALGHLVELDRAAEIHLPGGLRAWAEGDRLAIGRPPRAAEALPDVALPVPGQVDLPGWRITAELLTEGGNGVADRWTALLIPDVVEGLCVGSRRPGERIAIEGGHARIQDLLVNAKVPRSDRGRLPIVRSARGVVWVPGVRVAAWGWPTDGPPFLRVRVERQDDGE